MALVAFALRIDKHPFTHYLAVMRAQDAIQTRFAFEYQGAYHGRGNQWLSDLDRRDYLSGNDWQLLEPYSRPSQMPFQGYACFNAHMGRGFECWASSSIERAFLGESKT